MTWRHSNLLDLRGWRRSDFKVFIEKALGHKMKLGDSERKSDLLRGKVVANLFFEPSTRTRVSFEMAERLLGAEPINWSASGSSLSKGETLRDTAWTLQAMGVDAIVIRHPMVGTSSFLQKILPHAAVINAGDGAHCHPTQALLDVVSASDALGDLEGRKMVIMGDVLHSRVARSVSRAFKTLGTKVTLCGPRTLMPSDLSTFDVNYEPDSSIALKGADLVYLLRIQRERQEEGLFPSVREYNSFYGLSVEKIPDGAFVMHPGPINRDVEIDSPVADGDSSLILDQVRSGVAARMALLELCLGGK